MVWDESAPTLKEEGSLPSQRVNREWEEGRSERQCLIHQKKSQIRTGIPISPSEPHDLE